MLKQQIESDFLTAYKAGETAKVSILRMVKSAIKNAEISAKSELADPEIIKI
ncbi:MAG TPA: GatB/YqeY domain-containing protein, partial [Patescibacteria group bacterium]|nr:GatB/YqeY domain-containing protein [Patescibacteria group bacterium]